MHTATCASCGDSCEVPFKPNGKKPVYCQACFRKEDAAERLSTSSDRQLFEANCISCGESCEVPFRPIPGKPVYCRSCFASARGEREGSDHRPSPASASPSRDMQRQLDDLSSKLDQVLDLLSSFEVVMDEETSGDLPSQELPAKEALPAKKAEKKTTKKKSTKK